jgi:glutamyl-tRNA reductase
VSATGAAGFVVAASTLGGRSRPLFVLDLAVPRDVEPSAGEQPNVTLVDLDGLCEALAVRAAETAEDIERAHEIVAEELHRFTLRRRAEHLAPSITALRERGDAVAAAELDRFRSALAALAPGERATVEALARGIVAKLLHDPIVRLKELSTPGTQDAYAKMLADLFGLEPPAE